MINLLPPEVSGGYSYARRNVGLRRWVIIFVVALIGLGAITTYGLLSIQQAKAHYTKEIAISEGLLEKEKFAETQKQVTDIANSFKLVVKVLSKEVLFSELIKQIGATIPANANLTGLDISQAQSSLDISAVVPDYKTATQVQVNLADPKSKLFSKADIVSISCKGDENSGSRPCNVTIRALFAPNNPYLFINSKGTKQ